MGQAKARGTLEQRKAQAIERERAEREAIDARNRERRERWERERREAQAQADAIREANGIPKRVVIVDGDTVPRVSIRGARSFGLVTAIAAGLIASGSTGRGD